MRNKASRHERSPQSSVIEPLEDRALMSATLSGFVAAAPVLSQPASGSTAVLLPAVQKPGGFTAPQGNGIIAILIGL